MSIVNIEKVENETVKAIKAKRQAENELRTRAHIVMHGKKGIAQCENTGIEIQCIEFQGIVYSKFGEPLPDNWIWRHSR